MTINQVILRSRYFYWTVLNILYWFLQSIMPCANLDLRLIFQYSTISYWQVTYPYYILLIITTLERFAQIWIESRFGCSKEQIDTFSDIEEKVK